MSKYDLYEGVKPKFRVDHFFLECELLILLNIYIFFFKSGQIYMKDAECAKSNEKSNFQTEKYIDSKFKPGHFGNRFRT